MAIILLAILSLQTGSAATTTNINNTTSGGIENALYASNDGDTIELDEGTYVGVGLNTNLYISKNITIQGKTKDKVIIDGEKQWRIFQVGDNINVTFINITFINGFGPGYGAGVLDSNYGSTMTFVNCSFIQNSASSMGGAIFSYGNLNIIDSIFTDNTVVGDSGGAIASYGSLNIKNSTFTGNTAAGAGGAIFIASNNAVNVLDSIFTGNTAVNGGGIYMTTGSNLLNVIISNLTFIHNTAVNGGGAIHITTGVNCIIKGNISDSIFINNTASNIGGAIYISAAQNSEGTSANFDIINSTFTDNRAGVSGGATFISSTNITVVNVINSTFTNNTASVSGGGISVGIFNHETIVILNIIDSIIANNTANMGGGVDIVTSNPNSIIHVNITGSTIVNNTASVNGGGIRISTSYMPVKYNCSVNVNISDSNITNNVAGRDGGGILIVNADYGDVNASISNSNIINNSAVRNGGGIAVSKNDNATGDNNIDISNSVVNGNSGGGISITDSSNCSGEYNVNIDNSTINNNSLGIYNSARNTKITNSNIINNTDHGIYNNGDVILIDNVVVGNGKNLENFVNMGNVTGNNNIIDYGTKLTLTSSVSDNKVKIMVKAVYSAVNAIVGCTINFYVNGKLIGVATTNSAGIAELVYNAPNLGRFNLLATIDDSDATDALGTPLLYGSSATGVAEIVSKGTILTISTTTINEGKKTNIQVTLKDINGNILKNKKVSIKIAGKTYTATTSNNGIAIFKISNLKGGKYTVTAKFAGDNNYKSSIISKVQKVNSKVNLGIVSIKELKYNKKLSTCKVTIANTGSLKSKTTVVALYHIRNGKKIKTKYIKIKPIVAGKKISIIVNYFPDKANHRYCIAYFTLDPKNKNKEVILANNKKSIKLKH